MVSAAELKHKLARFGDYELDCMSGRLSSNGKPINLEPLVLQFLLLLIQHHGAIVPKQTVLDSLWPNKTPSDEALRAMVKKAREVLKDNARNPSYIKTIPTKGYMLIPNVVLSSTVVKTWFERNKQKTIKTGLFVTITLILLYYTFNALQTDKVDNLAVNIEISEISPVSAGDVSPYYFDDSLINISIARVMNGIFSEITISEIATKEQTKVTIADSLHSHFWWSSGSQTLLVTRTDYSAFFTIEFGQTKHAPFVTSYKYSLPENHQVLAIAKQGMFFYSYSQDEQKIYLVDLVNKQSKLLSDVNILKKKYALTNMNNIRVWPNPETADIMLSINTGEFTHLFILNTNDDASRANNAQSNISKITEIKGGLQSALWNKQGKRFSFTNKHGALFSYQLTSNRVTSWNSGGEKVNTLVADCGDACFIVSQTQGVPKLTQLSNPFYRANDLSFTRFMNKKTRAESLPFYTNLGLYFISESAAARHLVFKNNKGVEQVIHTFDKHSIIDEFSVNANVNKVVGLLNQRPFVLHLSTEKFEYVGITFAKISRLSLTSHDKLLFYAQPSNADAGVYEYNMATKELSLQTSGLIFTKSLLLVEKHETGNVSHRASLNIDENNAAWVSFQDDKQDIQLGVLSNTCSNCFYIHNNDLYHIQTGLQNFLLKSNLLNGDTSAKPLFVNELFSSFSLSGDAKELVLTSRQELQTTLLKMEGLVQMY